MMGMIHGDNPKAPSLPGLISHIQTVAEHEKATLARELHDDLGGMLVAASMDLAWLEQHIAAPVGDVRRRLRRLKETLGDAVDITGRGRDLMPRAGRGPCVGLAPARKHSGVLTAGHQGQCAGFLGEYAGFMS